MNNGHKETISIRVISCAFIVLAIAIFKPFGLYWRFKFRSRYLAAELEETRLLNEQLKKLQTSDQDSQIIEEATYQDSQITLEGTYTLCSMMRINSSRR